MPAREPKSRQGGSIRREHSSSLAEIKGVAMFYRRNLPAWERVARVLGGAPTRKRVSRLPDLLDHRPVRNRKAAMEPAAGSRSLSPPGAKSMPQKSLTEQRDEARPLFRWRLGR